MKWKDLFRPRAPFSIARERALSMYFLLLKIKNVGAEIASSLKKSNGLIQEFETLAQQAQPTEQQQAFFRNNVITLKKKL